MCKSFSTYTQLDALQREHIYCWNWRTWLIQIFSNFEFYGCKMLSKKMMRATKEWESWQTVTIHGRIVLWWDPTNVDKILNKIIYFRNNEERTNYKTQISVDKKPGNQNKTRTESACKKLGDSKIHRKQNSKHGKPKVNRTKILINTNKGDYG